jgi:type II secretory pathway component PulK
MMRRTDERGFILVAALWLLVALAGVGVHGALRMQTERLATANALDEARAREAALAGTEYALARLASALADREAELRAGAELRTEEPAVGSVGTAGGSFGIAGLDPWLQPGANLGRSARIPGLDPWREPAQLVRAKMAFGDAAFRLELRDVHAALSLNAADETTLRNFFGHGLELDYDLADRITQAILDWRDEDGIPRLGGAEREEYLREGRAYLPPNRPFTSVDELAHVMHVTPEIFEAARPYLSVLHGRSLINLNAAPEPVLRAVPGLGREGAAEILLLREAGVYPLALEFFDLLSPDVRRSIRADGDAFGRVVTGVTTMVEVLAEGAVEGSAVRSRVRTVLTRTPEGAFVVWREVGL